MAHWYHGHVLGRLIWLAIYLGLAADTVETASNSPMFLTIMPFLSTGFVPAESLPVGGVRQFAEYQPFTPGHRGPPWSSHRRNGSHRQRDRGNCLEPGHRRGILRTRPAHL